MRFAKYQGLGNDFLVVDLRATEPELARRVQDPATVVALCDRQFGVGGDGVLAILPSTTADARMRVLNSDGSEAEMCGNGIRCVAMELVERGGIAKRSLAIETGAGVLACDLTDAGVTVAMGPPRLTRAEIPMTGPASERCLDQPFEDRAITCVSMGNPHAITFVGSRDEAFAQARTLGPATEHHAWFPHRTNAEFAFVKSRREIELVVWERGCGITLACGTGACATAVAAILTGRCDDTGAIQVNLPGGALSIRVLPDTVMMSGPAVHVFDGELALEMLVARPA